MIKIKTHSGRKGLSHGLSLCNIGSGFKVSLYFLSWGISMAVLK